jgi:hypothetical protein
LDRRSLERVFDTRSVIDRVPMRDMAQYVPPRAYAGARVTRPDERPPVRAWIVDPHGRDLQVDGEAVAWTNRVVHVHYVDHGREGWAWVWASAVTRR